MSEDTYRTQLETALRQLDWREGIAKAALVEHLAADPPAQQAVDRSLLDAVYFSPADVLNSLPPGAWDEPPPAAPRSSEPAAVPAAPESGQALPDPLQRVPPPALAGAAGTVAMIGFIAALVWLLRRMRES